jgi:hypothetical protein
METVVIVCGTITILKSSFHLNHDLEVEGPILFCGKVEV